MRAGIWGLVICGGIGCKSGAPPGDWSLTLNPETHPNQSPFGSSPTIKLVFRRPTGDEVHAIGEASPGGLLELDDLPPADSMADVTDIGLAVEKAGGADDAIDLDKLTAYGEATFAGVNPGDALQSPVLVSELESIGDLGNIPGNQQRFLRGAALVPPGTVYLFAGASDLGLGSNAPSVVTADIFKLSSLDAGSPWKFDKVGTLPEKGDPPERLGLTATGVDVDGKPMILVIGGRSDLWFIGPSYDEWYLYDPAVEDVVDNGHLSVGRSNHTAVLMADGRVFVIGGFTGSGFDTGNADIVDPVKGKVTEVEMGLAARTAQGAASLGASGVMVCGGLSATQADPSTVTVYPDCKIVNVQGVAHDAQPLPIPLAHLALTPIGEGKVIATGGFTADAPFVETNPTPASNFAYEYNADTDTWVELNLLQSARSSHVGIPLTNGRALIIGGVDTDGAFYFPTGPVECPELFDSADGTFKLLQDQCGTWGSGAEPAAGSWDGIGTVFTKGFTVPGDAQDALGFVGSGPT